MIWARRFFAVFISIVFIGLFVGTMLLLRVNATLLSPDYINEQLRQADFFTFLYDDLAPLAVEEEIEKLDALPLGIQLNPADAVSTARQILPPEWIQTNVEEVVSQGLPYATGHTDEFAINIPVKDRVKGAAEAIKQLAGNSGAYEIISSQQFEDEVGQALQDFDDLPLGLTLQGEDLVWAVLQIVPPDWLQGRLEGALDEAIAYLTYESTDLNIVIPLADRVRAGSPVIKELLVRIDAYDGMVAEVTRDVVEENLGDLTFLPIDISIEAQEVIDAIQVVVPPEWLQEQVEGALEEFVAYLTGESNSFVVTVPLADRIELALQALRDLADRKMTEVFAGYPECSLDQAVNIAQQLQGGSLPTCQIPTFELSEVTGFLGIPGGLGVTWESLEAVSEFNLTILRDGVSLDTIALTFGIDIDAMVRDFIGEQLPDVYTFTQDDLLAFFSPEDAETFETFRDTVINGFVIDEDFLRDQLSDDQFLQLQDAREILRDGFTYTSADFREDIGNEDPEALDGLDTARSSFKTFDDLKFVIYGVWLVLLVGIGFLGGRQWWSRLAWAALPLFIASLFLFIATGPVYTSMAEPAIEQIVEDVRVDTSGYLLTLLDKGEEVAKTTVRSFLSGIKTQSLIIAFIGLATFAGAFVWGLVLKPKRRVTY
jgi:hypothetical protein